MDPCASKSKHFPLNMGRCVSKVDDLQQQNKVELVCLE
jgi:hypothetical protein